MTKIFGYTWNEINDFQMKRGSHKAVNTGYKGDYGSDPIGDGKFKMVPSGDIVDANERNLRLEKRDAERT